MGKELCGYREVWGWAGEEMDMWTVIDCNSMFREKPHY